MKTKIYKITTKVLVLIIFLCITSCSKLNLSEIDFKKDASSQILNRNTTCNQPVINYELIGDLHNEGVDYIGERTFLDANDLNNKTDEFLNQVATNYTIDFFNQIDDPSLSQVVNENNIHEFINEVNRFDLKDNILKLSQNSQQFMAEYENIIYADENELGFVDTDGQLNMDIAHSKLSALLDNVISSNIDNCEKNLLLVTVNTTIRSLEYWTEVSNFEVGTEDKNSSLKKGGLKKFFKKVGAAISTPIKTFFTKDKLPLKIILLAAADGLGALKGVALGTVTFPGIGSVAGGIIGGVVGSVSFIYGKFSFSKKF